jgi:hypothetical protein
LELSSPLELPLALSKSIAYQNSRGLHCLRRSPQAILTSQPKN